VQQPQLAAGAAAAGGGEDEGNEAEPMHQLRMLAYVHYEQLLQVLPWQLPHALPLPAAPSFTSSEDCARHLLAGPCALWLQLDVCTLHGGHKLGSCIVPLRVWDCDAAQVQFRCIEEQLLVVLYDPDNSINRTQGFAGPEQIPLTATAAAAAAQPAACVAAAVCSSEAGSSEGGAGVTAGSAAAGAAAGGLRGVLGQEACRQVLLGVQCLYDAGSCGRDGGARTAAQALGRLMETDEVSTISLMLETVQLPALHTMTWNRSCWSALAWHLAACVSRCIHVLALRLQSVHGKWRRQYTWTQNTLCVFL
jgi:hypothetical protein